MSRLITLMTATVLSFWREQTVPRQLKMWKRRIRNWGFALCALFLTGWLAMLGSASGSFEAGRNWVAQKTTETTVDAGFKVAEISVTGRNKTNAAEILKAVSVKIGDPILELDPVATKTELERLPWVETATVLRRLPGKILIEITERSPAAIWQNNKQLFLIDKTGKVLSDTIPNEFKNLPMIVGSDAASAVTDILTLLTAEPEISQRLDAATRVSGRRWDLKLKNGVDIKLPEENIGYALRRLAVQQQKAKLLDRRIFTIDLRFTDKIIVRTASPEKDKEDKKQKSI